MIVQYNFLIIKNKGEKMKFRVKVPPTREQGSYNCVASDRADALWSYNSAREHDGLPPIKRMPKGTTYEKISTIKK